MGAEKKIDRSIDKTRGFIKYSRENAPYRPAEKRLKDWDEIYATQHVRKGNDNYSVSVRLTPAGKSNK